MYNVENLYALFKIGDHYDCVCVSVAANILLYHWTFTTTGSLNFCEKEFEISPSLHIRAIFR